MTEERIETNSEPTNDAEPAPPATDAESTDIGAAAPAPPVDPEASEG